LKKIKLLLILIGLIFAMAVVRSHAWSVFGPNNYDDCVLEGLKTAKTDLAAVLVKQSCASKFKNATKTNQLEPVYDCSVVWSNNTFVKGTPANPSNYREFEIDATTVIGYIPKSATDRAIGELIKNNIELINKLCPFK
jgi:hypothetical protein